MAANKSNWVIRRAIECPYRLSDEIVRKYVFPKLVAKLAHLGRSNPHNEALALVKNGIQADADRPHYIWVSAQVGSKHDGHPLEGQLEITVNNLLALLGSIEGFMADVDRAERYRNLAEDVKEAGYAEES